MAQGGLLLRVLGYLSCADGWASFISGMNFCAHGLLAASRVSELCQWLGQLHFWDELLRPWTTGCFSGI